MVKRISLFSLFKVVFPLRDIKMLHVVTDVVDNEYRFYQAHLGSNSPSRRKELMVRHVKRTHLISKIKRNLIL